MRPVGRQHRVEDAEMRGNRFGELRGVPVASTILRPAARSSRSRAQNFLAVGKRRRRRCRRARRSPASAGPAPTPARTAPGTGRAGSCLQQQEQTFPQKVGCDQRPIEIDGKRYCVLVRPRIHFFRPMLTAIDAFVGVSLVRYSRRRRKRPLNRGGPAGRLARNSSTELTGCYQSTQKRPSNSARPV